ncbi:cupin domain-containing protein [Roseibium sp.]|uniref:cupin domain-containing protein n=1 Tax=Roseibium sp. TaxID=1936156 RepID=UPI003D0CC143
MTLSGSVTRAKSKIEGRRVHSDLPEKLGFRTSRETHAEAPAGLFTLSQLDKTALEPAPINPEWVLEGDPQARCKNLSVIGDDWTAVDHWSCTAGKFRWQYFLDETILILEGEAYITDDKGVEYHAVPGVTLSFPDGSAANWHVPEYVRKIAFNQKSVPTYFHKVCRAVNKLHRFLFK